MSPDGLTERPAARHPAEPRAKQPPDIADAITDVIDAVETAFVLVDARGEAIFINQAAAAGLGLRPDLAAGSPIWREAASILPLAAVDRCREALTRRAADRFETPGTDERRWFEVSVHPSRCGASLAWRDISTRKRAEMALLDAEERTRMTAEAGLIGLYDWDLRTGRLYWSDQHYRVLGLTPGSIEPSYAAWEERVHPDDVARVKADLRLKQEQHLPHHDVHRLVWPDGTVHVVETRAQFLYDEAGACVRMRGTYADVTDRVQGESLLRESEARFRVMADDTPLGIWVMNAAGQIQFANRRYCEFMGVERKAPSEPDWTLIHPDDMRAATRLQASVRDRKAFEGRARVRRADGEWRWVASRGQPRFSAAGEFLGLVCSSIDVTELVEAEERERTQVVEAHFRSLFEGVPGLFVVLTPGDYQVVAVSDAYLQATNMTRAGLIGTRFFEAFARDPGDPAPEPDSSLRASLERVVTERRVDVIGVRRFPIQRPAELGGGFEERWWSPVSAPLLGPDGSVAYIIHRVEDVTSYVTSTRIPGGAQPADLQAERRLQHMAAEVVQRAQELQRANDRLRENELRLQQEVADRRRLEEVRGHLIRQLVSVQEEERRRVARELHDSLGQHLTALGITLASLARRSDVPRALAADIERLQRIAGEIGDEVDHLASELRPMALDDLGLRDAIVRHVELWEHDTGIKADLHVRGLDRRLDDMLEMTVYRVVQEALTNVRRHARAERVSVVVEQRDGELVTVIEDDGVGFDPGGAPGDRDSPRHLGLSTMQERAALVGGHLEVESVVGRGTTVYLRVPNHA